MALRLFVEHDSDANFVPVNNADNWLDFGLFVAMVVLGILGMRRLQPGGAGPRYAERPGLQHPEPRRPQRRAP